jgi:ribosomal protein L4
MKLIHMQTTISTVFGVLDDDGNAIPQQPITVQVQRFDANAFKDAHGVVARARDEALAASEQESGDTPNRAARRAAAGKPVKRTRTDPRTGETVARP